jgi:transposase
MLSNEKKRLHHSIDGIDKKSIEKHIKFLQNEIAELDKKLNKTIDESEELKKKVKILETVPGIGKYLATKLISFVPELGNKNYSSI